MQSDSTALVSGGLDTCWFCKRQSATTCQCGRLYCGEHEFQGYCLVCALGMGIFEQENEPELVSGLLMLSLRATAGDPYIVMPAILQNARPLSFRRLESLIGALIKMLGSTDGKVRQRAASVLAMTTNSWPTMNPSPLEQHEHGTGLLAADQVRRWLMYTLKTSRDLSHEATALAILDQLRTADFRDLYPSIRSDMKALTCANFATRVREVFDAIVDFYPTRSHMANERCELVVYEQYVNRSRGAGKGMERIYGPLLKYKPELGKILKSGTWLSSQARYDEWYG